MPESARKDAGHRRRRRPGARSTTLSLVFVVFSQLTGELAPFEQLAAQASRFFSSRLELLTRGVDTIEVRLVTEVTRITERPRAEQVFAIRARAVTPEDRTIAAEAEARGRAYGMADLAARCARVWELAPGVPHGPDLERSTLTLCAVCASTGLGPVLPPDHATLYGVRGAIERRDRIPCS
jgi:hypothetical protein